jgi:hypothetical protein
MSQRDLEIKRIANYNKLDLAYRPKTNVLEIDINNTLAHELAKCVCFYLLRKGIPANLLPEFFKQKDWHNPSNSYMFVIQNGSVYKRTYLRPHIVVEARFKEGRRADLFCLDSGEKIEIETNKRVKKDDSITIYI